MKTLTKETKFGKATAIITVTAFEETISLDGEVTGSKVVMTTSVKVTHAGKTLDTAEFANVSGYESNPKWFAKMGLGKDQKISRVGDKAITMGAEAGEKINEMIEQMKQELAQEFNTKTEKQIQKEEEVQEAKAVVEQAKKEGISNLMTNAELKKWRESYNNLQNEGGEGYIPIKISKESYKKSLAVLAN
jgi:hypothetical protein